MITSLEYNLESRGKKNAYKIVTGNPEGNSNLLGDQDVDGTIILN
jgi:hypothetical protein